MTDFWTRRDDQRSDLADFLRDSGPLALLVDSVGNTGDALIREGTQHFLADAKLAYEKVGPDLHCEAAGSKTLVVRGSGGFDRHFHRFMPALISAAAKSFGKVVIFPSGFDPGEPMVARCLEPGNVFPMARDPLSLQRLAPFGRGRALMDCALFHRRFSPSSMVSAGNKMLVALRSDKASPLTLAGLTPNSSVNEDISCTTRKVDDWLDRISLAATVVTDRLHVAAAAVLLGKALIAIDPYDHKLSAYMAFAFQDSFSERICFRPVSWLESEGLASRIG